MRNVVINADLGSDNLERLQSEFPEFDFHMAEEPPDGLLGNAEILAGWLEGDTLCKAKNLKWFHSVSAGIDTFIGQVDSLRGDLLVTNGSGVYGIPIAEHLLALMLALTHRINRSVRNMPGGKWGGLPLCLELTGSTVGIAGSGDIGRSLARLLTPFGCEVLAFKRTPAEKPEGVSEMLYGDEGLDELMRRSDHICVCLPGTPGTRGLINRRRIGLVKSKACIYNIGRGYIIDNEALAEALAAGAIAGVGLDVTDPEPLPPQHALWQLENAVITPHIAGVTQYWERRTADCFAENLRAYAAGRKLPGAVDRKNKY